MRSKNKYRVNPSNVKDVSVRFNSVKKLINVYGSVLDAGGENDFAKALGIKSFIVSDLNYPFTTSYKYDLVTSFEVIEHLQNPLIYLESIKSCLKNNGQLCLTTPVRWIFKGKYHFHEFNELELLDILNMAGFRVIKMTRIPAYNLKHLGIRPVIRKIRDLIKGQCFYVVTEKY